MKANQVKFIRVMDGLWRDNNGAYRISQDFHKNNSPDKDRKGWRVYWTTWMNSKVSVWFPTLNEAKTWIREGGHHAGFVIAKDFSYE